MKNIIKFAALLLVAMVVAGCTGARVTETTAAGGSSLNTVYVPAGAMLFFNAQTGLLCIDATGSDSCAQSGGVE